MATMTTAKAKQIVAAREACMRCESGWTCKQHNIWDYKDAVAYLEAAPKAAPVTIVEVGGAICSQCGDDIPAHRRWCDDCIAAVYG